MRLPRSFHTSLRQVEDTLAPLRPFTKLEGAAKVRSDLVYAAFWRVTRHIWRGIAANLYSRWTPPAGVTVEDVEQQLLMVTWDLLCKGGFDTSRGRTLADYIIFNACNKAKYYLHQQRGANLHGNHDKNPSRAAQTFSELGIDLAASPGAGTAKTGKRLAPRIAQRMSVNATQLHAVERREKLEVLLAQCETVRERFALCALFYNDGSQVLATRAIYDDPIIRGMCRLGNKGQAAATVRRTARTYLGIEEED